MSSGIYHFQNYNPEEGIFIEMPFHKYLESNYSDLLCTTIYAVRVLNSKELRKDIDLLSSFPSIYDLVIKFIIENEL